ncbi:MAG: LamG-like jellyroll fold domain-containing protein [Deltaproteobacteria bacterium]|nr:LamG-like jellyroll fold domain-containing protein [Deltaproteobacteria bacterium]
MSRTPDPCLDELLNALYDRGLSDAESAQLADHLKDSAAQDRYVSFALLQQSLADVCSPRENLTLGAFRAPPAKPLEHGFRARFSSRSRIVGIGAIVAIAAAFLLFPRQPLTPVDEATGVAVITNSVNALWGAEGLAVKEGAPLVPGTLVLHSGLAQLDFYRGATLVMEGPAALELQGDKSARFLYGRIRTRVTESAKGLRISMPSGEIIDLGTEFGVNLDRTGQAEIHVFDGSVIWRRAGKELSLEQGQALRISPASTPAGSTEARVPADDTAFAGPGKISTLANQQVDQHRQAWLAGREKIRHDPATLLYFDFETTGSWGRTLTNAVAHAGMRSGDGAVVGCRFVAGRLAGKQALDFKRPSDRVLLNVPGHHPSFTIAAWVRFDGLDHRYNAFVHTDGWRAGSVHTHIQADGTIAIDRFGRERLTSTRRIGPRDLGQWMHLAWTWDDDNRVVSLFLDGTLDASMPITSAPAPTPDTPTFGSVQLGNWDETHRNLNGQLDEFVILSRALSAAEILALSRTGAVH